MAVNSRLAFIQLSVWVTKIVKRFIFETKKQQAINVNSVASFILMTNM